MDTGKHGIMQYPSSLPRWFTSVSCILTVDRIVERKAMFHYGRNSKLVADMLVTGVFAENLETDLVCLQPACYYSCGWGLRSS